MAVRATYCPLAARVWSPSYPIGDPRNAGASSLVEPNSQAKHRTGYVQSQATAQGMAYLVPAPLETADLLAGEAGGGLLALDVRELGAGELHAALGGLDPVQQRPVLLAPQQLVHLLSDRRAQPLRAGGAFARALAGGASPADAASASDAAASRGERPRGDESGRDERAEERGVWHRALVCVSRLPRALLCCGLDWKRTATRSSTQRLPLTARGTHTNTDRARPRNGPLERMFYFKQITHGNTQQYKYVVGVQH